MCLAPLVVELSLSAIPLTLAVLGLVAFGLTGLGYTIAWSLDSTQGFHAIMNLFLIPLWLLSGAVFPPMGAPEWLQWIMVLNPLTYGVDAVRWSLYGSVQYAAMGRPEPLLSLAIVIAFAVATFLMSLYITKKR